MEITARAEGVGDFNRHPAAPRKVECLLYFRGPLGAPYIACTCGATHNYSDFLNLAPRVHFTGSAFYATGDRRQTVIFPTSEMAVREWYRITEKS